MRVDLVAKPSPKIIYPCLMVNRQAGLIVYATSKTGDYINGVIIALLDSSRTFREGLPGPFLSENFVPYDGKVTLSND